MDASLLRSEYFISVAIGLAVYVMTVITLYPGLLNTSQQQLPSATRTVREGSSILLRETWTNMFQLGYNPPQKKFQDLGLWGGKGPKKESLNYLPEKL